MDLFYFHYRKKRVLFHPFKNEKVWIVAQKYSHSSVSAHLTRVFSSSWTLDCLHPGRRGQQSGQHTGAGFPAGQPEPPAPAGAGQPDRCCRCTKPLQTGHHVLQEYTRFVGSSLSILPHEERGCC